MASYLKKVSFYIIFQISQIFIVILMEIKDFFLPSLSLNFLDSLDRNILFHKH